MRYLQGCFLSQAARIDSYARPAAEGLQLEAHSQECRSIRTAFMLRLLRAARIACPQQTVIVAVCGATGSDFPY
jgi:hypothetical protein